jgi:CheY-like chemotaxis protein
MTSTIDASERPAEMKAQIVVYAPSRQVVLIVEGETLFRVTAVDMIEEAGFEVLEAANAREAILLLEARRDITVVFTEYRNAGFDGWPQAR